MKSSFCIDLQRFMLIPTKFPLSHNRYDSINQKWIGPDSARINRIDAEANKIEMNKKEYKNKQNENK